MSQANQPQATTSKAPAIVVVLVLLGIFGACSEDTDSSSRGASVDSRSASFKDCENTMRGLADGYRAAGEYVSAEREQRLIDSNC
jgi:hypothetical protein